MALKIGPGPGTADLCPCREDPGEVQESQGHNKRADGSSDGGCGRGLTYNSPFIVQLII